MEAIVKSKIAKIILIGILILTLPLLVYCADMIIEFILEVGRFIGTIIVNISVKGI